MCGICGYAGTIDHSGLKRMNLIMSNRGPDDKGEFYDDNLAIGLGHRRLSIIDLSENGHQPMLSSDGTVCLSYNGEIYNHEELREELLKKGYTFKGRSDTEVVLRLYEEFGIDFLEKLNGMFAIAIWDSREKQLFLARDHAGIKPLYFWQSGHVLYFASEIKALLQIQGIPRRLNESALFVYLTLLWCPGEDTLFREINKLEPGHLLTWKSGKVDVRPWFRIVYEPDETLDEHDWAEAVREEFGRAVNRQMVSDVTVGAFLSGGLDSSSIVACMRELNPDRQIPCYTIKFTSKGTDREGFEDDYPHAVNVAKHLRTDLNTISVGPDIVSLLPKTVYQMDEPDADPTAILTYLVAKAARESGTTVLLSGTGGDEVFFGYRSHLAYYQYQRLKIFPKALVSTLLMMLVFCGKHIQGAQSPMSRRANKFRRGLVLDGLDRHLSLVDWSDSQTRNGVIEKTFTSNFFTHDTITSALGKYFHDFCGQGEINRHTHILNNTFLASHNFLYNDKCTMASSIETRVPFMDVELMRLCAKIPEKLKIKNGISKYVLKKAMEAYLPGNVIYRSKTGFGPPVRDWVVGGLGEIIDETLSYGAIKQRGIFDPHTVRRMIDENKANKADHAYLIFALFNLEIWLQTFIDKNCCEVTF